MTLEEFVEAIENRLGRPLEPDEAEWVEADYERRTTLGDPDFTSPMVIGGIADAIRRGAIPADPAEDDEDAEPERDIATPDPDAFQPGTPGQPVDGRSGPTARIPPDLERRFREAATTAGMQPAQIEAELVQVAAMFADPAMRSQAETLFEGRIADLEQGAPTGPRPIGVPDDFVAQRTFDPANPASFGAASVPSTLGIDPRYFDGDEFSPAGLSPEQVAGIQSRLEAAGLLNPDSYWAGTWDTASVNAYKSALGMANASGRSIDEQIDQLISTLPESVKEQRRRAEAAETFQAQPFMRPDPDALAQSVKDTFRRMLGREPTPEDLAWGVQGLGADYREQYESEVAAARAQFDAGQGEPAPAAIQSQDPTSSFRQRFEERFSPEIDRLAALPEVRDNMNNVFASLRTMSSLIGP